MSSKGWFFGVILSVFFLSGCGSARNENQNAVSSTGSADQGGAPASNPGSPPATDPSPAPNTPPPTPAASSTAPDVPPPTDHGGAPSNPPVNPPAGWRSLGGQINPGGAANTLSMKTVGEVPYVAWEEEGKIYVSAWDGSAWKKEGPLNNDSALAASLPTLAADGAALYLSWTEGASAYVEKRENGTWVRVAVQSTLGENCFPANADLAARQGVPTLVFDAFCPDTQYASTLVEQWTGSWSPPARVGTRDHYADTPSPRKYALADGTNGLYLAVMEGGMLDERELRLYHRDPDGWSPVGGAVNDLSTFFEPPFASAFFQDAPYVIFKGDGIRVKRLDGAAWTPTGAVLSADGVDPVLIDAAQRLYAAFGGPDVEVWRWDGSVWTREGAPLNLHAGSDSRSVALGATDHFLYAAWIENGSIYMKRLAS